MRKAYILRTLLVITQQIFSIAYLCLMAVRGYCIPPEDAVPFCLLTLLFADAAYVSYRNIRNNAVLTHFSTLLLLLGWQLLLSLYEAHGVSAAVSAALLPLCLFQTLYFLQSFFFQAAAYRFQKPFLLLSAITCLAASLGFAVSPKVFAIAYQLQFLLSFLSLGALAVIHCRRLWFVLKSQKKQLLLSAVFVLLPFLCYVGVFQRQPAFLNGMGSYLAIMLVSVSIHSIVFMRRPDRNLYLSLQPLKTAFLTAAGISLLFLIAGVCRLQLTAVFLILYAALLLMLLYQLLLYLQLSRASEASGSAACRRHFYTYSLEQIKREETLKREFSQYLHDTILQDLLSVKNLLGKAEQPEIKQLLDGTLSKLTASLRLQMQAYHPALLKSLTFRENLRNLLDTLFCKSSAAVVLNCSESVFLVEPYDILVYRTVQELAANALKHADASEVTVFLSQERGRITLKLSDNGCGFSSPEYSHASHRGLDSIREQICLLDGSMNIQSSKGAGTRITITMPMKGDDSYENFVGR